MTTSTQPMSDSPESTDSTCDGDFCRAAIMTYSIRTELNYSMTALRNTPCMLVTLRPLYNRFIHELRDCIQTAASGGISYFFCDVKYLREFSRTDAETLVTISNDLTRVGSQLVLVNVTTVMKAIFHACSLLSHCRMAAIEDLATLSSVPFEKRRIDDIIVQGGRSLKSRRMTSSGNASAARPQFGAS